MIYNKLDGVCIVTLLLLGVSLASGQEIDIWDLDQDTGLDAAQEGQILESLCNNINLIVYDKATKRQFDCAIKEWEIAAPEGRIITKREAVEDVASEGSGAGENSPAAPIEEAAEENAPIEEAPVEEAAATEPAPIEEAATETILIEETTTEEVPIEEAAPATAEAPKEATALENKNEAEPKEVEPETAASASTTELAQSPVPIIPIKENPTLFLAPTVQDEDRDAFQDANTLMENHPEIDGNSRSQPIVIPGPRSMQETEPEPKESEAKVDGKNEETTSEKDAAPKTGESAKAASDSNILIMMFVGVVVVGVAAFGYNYIRKRNQGSEPVPADDVEKAEKAEKVEQEMHPLMNGKEQQLQQQQHPHDQEQVYKPTTSALN